MLPMNVVYPWCSVASGTFDTEALLMPVPVRRPPGDNASRGSKMGPKRFARQVFSPVAAQSLAAQRQ